MRFIQFVSLFAVCGLAVASAQQTLPTPPPQPGAAAAPQSVLPPDTVVLSVGEFKLTRADFENILAALAQGGRPASTPAAKRQVAEQFGEMEGLAQEARKRKLDQDPTVKEMMRVQADSFLARSLAEKLTAEVQLSETDLQAYYSGHKSEYEQAEASHILIRYKGSPVPLKPNEKDLTEEEALAKAQDLRKQIEGGADFATLAKSESDDAGSAAKGGALGKFGHGQMVGPFDKAAFSAPVGKLTEPVKTQFGFHLIKVESRETKSFEQAKPEIERQLRPKMAQEAGEKIKKETPVTLNDAYFVK